MPHRIVLANFNFLVTDESIQPLGIIVENIKINLHCIRRVLFNSYYCNNIVICVIICIEILTLYVYKFY